MLIWVRDNSTCHIWRSGLNQKLPVFLLGAVPKGALQDPGAVNKPVLCAGSSQQHPHLLGGAGGERRCWCPVLSPHATCLLQSGAAVLVWAAPKKVFFFAVFFWLILKPSWLALPALGFTSV